MRNQQRPTGTYSDRKTNQNQLVQLKLKSVYQLSKTDLHRWINNFGNTYGQNLVKARDKKRDDEKSSFTFSFRE